MKDDIFLLKSGQEKDDIRVTDWPGPDGQLRWSPDGKRLAYVSDRFGTWGICVADAETYETRCLVQENEFPLRIMGYTPDGKSILFWHGPSVDDGVFSVDVDTGEVTAFLPDPNIFDIEISPDGRWVLAAIDVQGGGSDLYVKPVEGGGWVNVTKPAGWEGQWSPDGRKIFFTSWRDGNGEIYSVDLQRQPVRFNDYQEQIEEREKPSEDPEGEAKAWERNTIAPIEIDFERIEARAQRLTNTPEAEDNLMILPDGKTIVYTRGNEIWAMDLDGKNQRQYVTGTVGLWNMCLQGDGEAIFFLDGGELKKVSARGGEPTEMEWEAEIHRDEREIQTIAFRQAWAFLDEYFYFSDFHGVDWKAEYERYAPYCDGTLVTEDLHHLIKRMIGELNASHLGIFGDPQPSWTATACLGITADPEHRGPGLRVADVMPDGPADQPGPTIAVGEYIMGIEGEEVDNSEEFHRRLNGRTGEPVILLVNNEARLEDAREISIKPVMIDSIRDLRYERWVRNNCEMVRELSDGRVYYAWIEWMGPGPVESCSPMLSVRRAWGNSSVPPPREPSLGSPKLG